MSGQHASRLRFFPRRTQPAAPPVATDPDMRLPRRTADREAVAAGHRARTAPAAQRDIPTTLLPALRAWTPKPLNVPREYAAEPVTPYWNPGRGVAVDLAGTGDQWTAPAPRSAFVADWRDLKHFRATCKTRGWCGLAMRGNAS
jgi:hypothetical protein